MEQLHVVHPFAPVFDAHSRVLVLGSLPSVRSRENHFYYGHPQNRFWRVLAAVFHSDVPQTVEEKTALLLKNGVALWDVIAECDVSGSSDASIRAAVPNDLSRILSRCRIEHIYANGQTAAKLYTRLQAPLSGMAITPLPSTSPANAAWTLPKLCDAWQVLRMKTPPGSS